MEITMIDRKLTCYFCNDTDYIEHTGPEGIIRVPCPQCHPTPVPEVIKPQGVIDAEDRRNHARKIIEKYGHATAVNLDGFAQTVHGLNALWEIDIRTGEPIEPDFPEMLMLTVSELSEALEGFRKDIPDTHLPQFPMMGVELADALIRIFHIAARFHIDLGPMVIAKCLYNVTRPDHQYEARIAKHGKKI
jgi:hypothetical protein